MDSPPDIETLRAALAAERARAAHVEAELTLARAKAADDAATIARQNLEIAKLKRQIYGPRSERTGSISVGPRRPITSESPRIRSSVEALSS